MGLGFLTKYYGLKLWTYPIIFKTNPTVSWSHRNFPILTHTSGHGIDSNNCKLKRSPGSGYYDLRKLLALYDTQKTWQGQGYWRLMLTLLHLILSILPITTESLYVAKDNTNAFSSSTKMGQLKYKPYWRKYAF